jgi:phosphatidylserine/phosphatidylglycerophosphate/cardiolipin synthase-like enzyme
MKAMWWMPTSRRSRIKGTAAEKKRGLKAPFLFALLLSLGLLWSAGAAAAPQGPCQSEAPLLLVPDRSLEPVLFGLIRKAQKEIHIGIFLFKCAGHPQSVPSRLGRALIKASRRGVKVWVLMERAEDPLSEVGRENPRCAEILRRAGIEVRMESPSTRSHMKVVVVDGRYVLLGSHNFTQSAFRYNRELSIMTESPCLARKVIQYLRGVAGD